MYQNNFYTGKIIVPRGAHFGNKTLKRHKEVQQKSVVIFEETEGLWLVWETQKGSQGDWQRSISWPWWWLQ